MCKLKKPYQLKTFLCILLVILSVVLPLTIYAAYYQYRNFDVQKSRFEENLESDTKMMQQLLDDEISNLKTISLSIQDSSQIRAYNYDPDNSPLSTKRGIIDELMVMNKISSFTSEIWVCIRKNQAVYTSNGLYNLGAIVPDIYSFSSWTKNQFVYDVTTSKISQWRKQENILNKGNYLSVLHPIPENNSGPYATILYLISSQDFNNIILAPSDPASMVNVYDNTGQVIFTNASGLRFSEENFENTDGGDEIQIGNDMYYRTYAISPNTGFKVISYMEATVIQDRLQLSPSLIWTRITILLLIAFFAAFFAAVMLYRPYWRIAGKLSFHTGEKPLQGMKDMLETLDMILENNFQQGKILQLNKNPIREFIYESILCGTDSWRNILLAGESACIFSVEYYFVVHVQIHAKINPNIEKIQALIENRDKWILPGYEYHLKISYLPNIFYIIVGTESDDHSRIQHDLNHSRKIMTTLIECDISFGVGGTVDGIDGIRESFLEAMKVQRYQIFFGKNNVLFAKQLIDLETTSQFYPQNQLNEFIDGVRTGDEEKTDHALEMLKNNVIQTRYSLEMVELIVFDIASHLFRCSVELLEPAAFESVYEQIFSIRSFENVSTVIKKFFMVMKPQVNKDSPTLELMKIYQIINAQYCEYTFTVQSLAENLGVSSSTMTHYFKRNTGTTVLDYINRKRLDRAVELLTTTDLTLNEIVKSIGFSDSSTFIKKFRSVYGITPRQYRERKKAES